MKPVLIIIRGNHASGKTTLAVKLQERLGVNKTFLIQPSSDDDTAMMTKLAQYGHDHFEYTLIEGQLAPAVYESSIENIIKLFGEQTLVYYLDLTLDQTVQLDQQKGTTYGRDQLTTDFQPYESISELEVKLTGLILDEKINQITDEINRLPLF